MKLLLDGHLSPEIARQLRERGHDVYGLVCVPRRFSLSRKEIGRVVRVLGALLQARPHVDAAIALGGEIWLDDPTGT